MSYYYSLAKLYSSPQNILSSYEKHCFMKSILYSWKKQPLGITQDSDDYERNELSDPSIYYSSDEYYTSSEENINSDYNDDDEEINNDEEFSFREYFGMLELLTSKTECIEYRKCTKKEVLKLFKALQVSLPSLSNHDALRVDLYYGNTNDSGIVETYGNSEWFAKFSSTPFNIPRNRLSEKFGNETFLILKVNIPPISLNDIVEDFTRIEYQNQKKLDEMYYDRYLDTLQEERLQDVDLMWRLLSSHSDQDTSPFKLPRSNSQGNILELERFNILGEEFNFLCCNTSGALTYKFTLVHSKKKEQVEEWCVPTSSDFNKENIFKEDEPFKHPLRKSLMNTTCIKTCCIDRNEIQDIDDIETNGSIMTDGCGYIADVDLWNEILSQYRCNWKDFFDGIVKQRRKEQNYMEVLSNSSSISMLSNSTISEDLVNIDNQTPHMLQVRFSGYKGMLILLPNSSASQISQEKKLFLPKSMKKIDRT